MMVSFFARADMSRDTSYTVDATFSFLVVAICLSSGAGAYEALSLGAPH
jgi:hypothetical protein